ncbi:MAG: threonine/serine dehydratase [Alphaproteobacteria bacterium]|nr:threonine/serine dehydratase [Pseudomonadota bacterium]TDI68445.1 MAG: threonine/serine dehydratase [Alphaproteobacteria bacterium]
MTVGLEEIRQAAARIAGKAVRTPMLEAPLLNQRAGCRVLVKAESLQLTGSFKFRGAYNRIAQLTRQERGRGVVAYSTGNHAQGVAAAARSVGTAAIIVVPNDIPAIKKANTLSWGAELAFYERGVEDRVAVAEAIADKRRAVIVPPFDDDRVIAGQGTIGLELVDQAAALGVALDAVVIPCGGGGLSAGIATAVKALSPETRIFLVEPINYDDTLRSMAAGDRVANDPGHGTTFCDALTAEMPGELTFAINQRLADGVLAIDDDRVADGLYAAFADLKLVVEPSGAIALAALVTGALGQEFDVAGKTIAVIASGGNVDPLAYRDALQKAAARRRAH